MFDITRELIAYGLIGLVCVVGAVWLGIVLPRRKREKLRRRGVKHYNR